jgi:hypothetical protein
MQWKDPMVHSKQGESIAAGDLRAIPQLKDCPHWDRAVFLGTVSHQVPFASYEGGLVKYDGKIYYVNMSQIEALRSFVRWNLKKHITVTES